VYGVLWWLIFVSLSYLFPSLSLASNHCGTKFQVQILNPHPSNTQSYNSNTSTPTTIPPLRYVNSLPLPLTPLSTSHPTSSTWHKRASPESYSSFFKRTTSSFPSFSFHLTPHFFLLLLLQKYEPACDFFFPYNTRTQHSTLIPFRSNTPGVKLVNWEFLSFRISAFLQLPSKQYYPPKNTTRISSDEIQFGYQNVYRLLFWLCLCLLKGMWQHQNSSASRVTPSPHLVKVSELWVNLNFIPQLHLREIYREKLLASGVCC